VTSARAHVLALLPLLLAGPALAQTSITIVNADGLGEGFNDPTPLAPVGGNPGTTRGEQRLNVFREAADIWASLVESGVTIEVEASFDPLPCSPFSAVLGSAGPTTVHRDFAGALVSSTWYPQALANSLAGSDLSPSVPDLGATFNSSIDDNNACLIGLGWYLGLDGNGGGDIDLLAVVLHEIGHGLGFLTLVNDDTGARFFSHDDVFMKLLEDHSTGQTWDTMNDPERAASAIDTGDLHWVGSEVVAASGPLTNGVDPTGHVQMYAPNPTQAGSSLSHWDTALQPNELMEPSITSPPIHDPGLAFELMVDIGWAPAPVQVAPCAGDVDGDGATGLPDFNILAENYSKAVPAGTLGDLNGDGFVGQPDYVILSTDFGCQP
jgi:hypothetical protein